MTATETAVRTLDLSVGDQVALTPSVLRTVESVRVSGYVNSRNQPIYTVRWAEGSTPEWSEGNTGSAVSVWPVVRCCEHSDGEHAAYSHMQAAAYCPPCKAWC